MLHIGAKIKTIIQERRLTVTEVAEALGKSKQAVYDIFEKEDVNTEIIKKISRAFSIPLYFFVDEQVANLPTEASSQISPVSNTKVSKPKHKVGGDENDLILIAWLEDKDRLIKAKEEAIRIREEKMQVIKDAFLMHLFRLFKEKRAKFKPKAVKSLDDYVKLGYSRESFEADKMQLYQEMISKDEFDKCFEQVLFSIKELDVFFKLNLVENSFFIDAWNEYKRRQTTLF